MIVECPGCQSRYDVSGRPPKTKARCRCGTVFTLPKPTEAAGALSCPTCNANVSPTASQCSFCQSQLLVKACPRCFARVFHGAEHCRACGAKVDVPAQVGPDGQASVRACPRCENAPGLEAQLVGDVLVDACPACLGLWLDAAAVERVISERRQATATAILGLPEQARASKKPTRLYIKCPDCDRVMNRVNFGRSSGVIIDTCKGHGTWFDADELPKIVAFVMDGGLEESERRHIERLRERAKRESDRARAGNQRVGDVWLDDHPTTYRGSYEVFSGILGAVGRFLSR